ncbi:hypothetical protein [Sinosporangium album]|nr:hypothetical protein [Sinosporangium album]
MEDLPGHAEEKWVWNEASFIVRARKLTATALALVVLSLATAVWGRASVHLPVMNPGMAETLPLAILLPVPYACVISLVLRSGMADFDRIAARSMAQIDLICMATATLSALLLISVGLFAGQSAELAPLVLRNTLWWTGIACLSAWIFGRSLGWVLPIVLLVPLYESAQSGSAEPPAWSIPRYAADSLWSWTVTAAALGGGVALILFGDRLRHRLVIRVRRVLRTGKSAERR